MFDHLSGLSGIAEPQQCSRIAPPKRRRARPPGAFAGVDLGVIWDGSTRALVQTSRNSGLERLFVLRSVWRSGRVIWQADDRGGAREVMDISGCGLWLLRFDVLPEAGRRAEAHLPRLLESIASRMVWQHVEKRRDLSVAQAEAAFRVYPSVDQWKGDAA